MVRLAQALPERSYQELVEQYGDEGGDTPHVYIRRDEEVRHDRLVVLISTHNEGRKYSGLADSYRMLDADLLFIRDVENSYYLRADKGAAFDALIVRMVEEYRARDVLFFGSSMAGYAALRFALIHNANALLSNPQVSLTASIPHAWNELRRNIEKIPERIDLGKADFRGRQCAITLLHSRHSMDVTNTRLFLDLYRRSPGIGLTAIHSDDRDHKYLIPDFKTFTMLVRRTYELRRMRDRIVAWGRIPK